VHFNVRYFLPFPWFKFVDNDSEYNDDDNDDDYNYSDGDYIGGGDGSSVGGSG